MKTERGQGLVEPLLVFLLFAVPLFLLVMVFLGPAIENVVDSVNDIRYEVNREITGIKQGDFSALFDNYSDIPLTTHAKESHAEDEWNAITISQAFDANRCKPQITECRTRDFHWCEVEPGVEIGLVVGGKQKNTEVLVTGFAADEPGYWNECGDTP